MSYVVEYWNYFHKWYGFKFTLCCFTLCGMWEYARLSLNVEHTVSAIHKRCK